ncbi:unnamed protein product [Linum tenue]|uniref:Uncharacterized protein n=1 Tax=Linum tenue TaxID=586396 RepID=A0AAV0MGA4_9ROSI|nr:unnamed protein product [Linum tenue]
MQLSSISHLLLLLLPIVLCFLPCLTALTSPQDVSALKALKSAISPASIPPWSCLASWDFAAADPCSLPRRTHFVCGLACSPDSTRVTQLTLDPVGYSGQLTPLLSQLTALLTLDLADNYFSGPIPASIGSIASLQSLTLRSNSFSGPIPAALTTLNLLESVDLSRNRLEGGIPKGLDSMLNLRRLDLSYNKLTGSVPKLPPNLLELAVRANSLTGPLAKSAFERAAQLEVVDLGENSLGGTVEAWFFQLPAIQQVNLANNSLTRVVVPRGSGKNAVGQLVAVDLGFNEIEGEVPANFAGFPSLSALSLRYNKLRGRIPLEYSRKKSLRRLFLDGNYLIGKPPAGFFGGGAAVAAGSLGDNCLEGCPGSSQLCSPSQKSSEVCKQAYGGRKPRS